MLTLEIRNPNGQTETKRFAASVTIGRDTGDIAVGDPQVSARHAEIQVSGGTATYVDLGSTNGSFTPQGEAITRLPLAVGTIICLGTSKISVLELPEPALQRLGPRGTLVVDVPKPPPPSAQPLDQGSFPSVAREATPTRSAC